jgi:hypothetical protein
MRSIRHIPALLGRLERVPVHHIRLDVLELALERLPPRRILRPERGRLELGQELEMDRFDAAA